MSWKARANHTARTRNVHVFSLLQSHVWHIHFLSPCLRGGGCSASSLAADDVKLRCSLHAAASLHMCLPAPYGHHVLSTPPICWTIMQHHCATTANLREKAFNDHRTSIRKRVTRTRLSLIYLALKFIWFIFILCTEFILSCFFLLFR